MKKIVKIISIFLFIIMVLFFIFNFFNLTEKEIHKDKQDFIETRSKKNTPQEGTFKALLTESIIPNCAEHIIFKYNMDSNQYSLSYTCKDSMEINNYINNEWRFIKKEQNRYFFSN